MLLLNSLINSTIGAEYYSIDQRYKLLSIPIDLVESDTVEFHLEENKYFNKLYIMLWWDFYLLNTKPRTMVDKTETPKVENSWFWEFTFRGLDFGVLSFEIHGFGVVGFRVLDFGFLKWKSRLCDDTKLSESYSHSVMFPYTPLQDPELSKSCIILAENKELRILNHIRKSISLPKHHFLIKFENQGLQIYRGVHGIQAHLIFEYFSWYLRAWKSRDKNR